MMQFDLTKNTTKASLQSFRFPIHKVISCTEAKEYLFEGMNLELREVEGRAIAVVAYFDSTNSVVGIIPKGMLPHLEDVIAHQSQYCVQVDSIECAQLVDKMWISIDELPLIMGVPV
jgi:hypothetical protein